MFFTGQMPDVSSRNLERRIQNCIVLDGESERLAQERLRTLMKRSSLWYLLGVTFHSDEGPAAANKEQTIQAAAELPLDELITKRMEDEQDASKKRFSPEASKLQPTVKTTINHPESVVHAMVGCLVAESSSRPLPNLQERSTLQEKRFQELIC